MKKIFVTILFLFCFIKFSLAENENSPADNLFHIGQMNSHDKNFSLFFKPREKAVLARGENFNYITDYPQDLYIYNYTTKISSPFNLL